MQRVILFAAALASGLAAQSNTVPGLDGRLTVIDNMTYYGRQGASHPNGEIGMAMLNTMCNPGSIPIPWFQAMQPDHPKFGFMVVRVHGDRIEQINDDRSFCKHAFLSINVNGACGSCINPPAGGAQMGINCSDTYGPGNNASRTWLGPAWEINPWTGVWNPVGSYFDVGHPNQSGYPLPADGNRSLNYNFNNVENRVTVAEQDMLVAGASYYYGLQLIHEGEALANRGDNLAHRGFNPTWGGSSWSFPNNAEGQVHGTILDRWPGANVEVGTNGTDDGRVFVATKVTSLGGGNYHYEYAVHNVDSSRGLGSFRVPIDPTATASNFSFRDLDGNAGNNWTAQQIGNEIVFTDNGGSNPQEWNEIYNFGFDADFPPGASICQMDAARPGPGGLWTEIPAEAPSGATLATVTPYGQGCGGTGVTCDEAFYEFGSTTDLANSSWTLDYDSGTYTLVAGQGSWIAGGTDLNQSDDDEDTITLSHTLPYPSGSASQLAVCSNGFVSHGSNGTEYNPSVAESLGGNPRWMPLWHDLSPNQGGAVRWQSNAQRTVVTWDDVENFSGTLTATFQIQFWANGDVHVLYQGIGIGGNDYLTGFSLGGGATDPGGIDISNSLNGSVAVCNSSSTPDVSLVSSGRPIVGTTINLITNDVPAGGQFQLSILSPTQIPNGIDLTFLGMGGCFVYLNLDIVELFPVVGGVGTRSFAVPSNPSLSGQHIFNQAAPLVVGINAFNTITTNGLDLGLGIN